MLSIDISFAEHTVDNDAGNVGYTVGAVFVEPFHNDGKNTRQIEFYNIGAFFFGDSEPYEYRVKDMGEHFFIHLAEIHSMELLESRYDLDHDEHLY